MILNIKQHAIIIDDEDSDKLSAHHWYPVIFSNGIYIACMLKNPRTIMLMHRFIMGLTHGDIRVIDHINGNTLDNRKSNLRICTQAQNSRNSKFRKSNTSGYKGVTYDKRRDKWVAQIKYNWKHIHLGQFDDPREAYIAYCEGSRKYHGDFGRTI